MRRLIENKIEREIILDFQHAVTLWAAIVTTRQHWNTDSKMKLATPLAEFRKVQRKDAVEGCEPAKVTCRTVTALDKHKEDAP